MATNNQKLIHAARMEMMERKRLTAVARKHAKQDAQKTNAELTLLIEDLQTEGVDIRTPEGMAILLSVIQKKTMGHPEYRSALDDNWPEGF